MIRLGARLLACAAISVASLGWAADALAQPRKSTTADAREEGDEINLAVGENRTIPANDVRNYTEGSTGIVDIKLTSDGLQFVILGTKPGQTTLLLIRKDGTKVNYNINVFSRPPAVVERELRQLLEGSVGIRVRRIGSKFFLEGGVSTEADQKRLTHIAALYPGQVESLAEVGSLADDRQFNIRIDYYFVQFSKDTGYQVGLAWPTKIGGATVVTNSLTYDFIAKTTSTATAAISNQPLPSLDIASNRGWAKVLKQATLIAGNGAEAKFNSGGEQNFGIANNLSTTVHAISFGVNITVVPRFDRTTKDLEVKISAENDDLTAPAPGTILPSRDISKLSSIVHLKLGQSIVLSGISTRSQRHQVAGLPGLSEIPILGILFGSHLNATSQVEGAVIMIPSVIDSLPRASLEGVRRAAAQYESYSGDIQPIDFINKTPPVIEIPGTR